MAAGIAIRQADAVTRLLDEAVEIVGSGGTEIADLARILLGADPMSVPWRSTLNADGAPLQVCATLGDGGARVRLIGDPGARHLMARRITGTMATIEAVARHAAPAMLGLVRDLAAAAVPDAPEDTYLTAGIAWVAASPVEPGIAAYFNASRGALIERWSTAEVWLGISEFVTSRQMLARVRDSAAPVSYAVEGLSEDVHRKKVYVRLLRSRRLDAVGVPAFAIGVLNRFLSALDGVAVKRSGLTVSLGFGPDREIMDVKVDLCAHCLDAASKRWRTGFDDFVGDRRFDHKMLRRLLSPPRSEVAIVGFGVGRTSSRINVYLKPTLN